MQSPLSQMSPAIIKSYRNRQGDASADEFAAGIIFVALRLHWRPARSKSRV
ncbi:MAG: hypothetical protein OXH75_29260 [Acidobacteria bacterium]|nr:hypothetical protein [Acidobacteriota bacterium]